MDNSIDPAAAALIEPFACVLRGQEALRIQPGESVLIIGAGPIGIMHALLAQFRGAGRIFISELNPLRCAQAETFGIGQVIQPAQGDLVKIIKSETGGDGVDVVIVAAPAASAQEVSLELAALGGRINFFGGLPKERSKILFDSNLVHYKELTVTGTTACSTDNCRQAAAIASSGRLDLARIVGARFPLEAAAQAFQAAEDGTTLKVVMEP